MYSDCHVRVRFHQPSPALRPYFTTFYLTEIEVPDGQRVVDWLHPEWANLRCFRGDLPLSEIQGEPPLQDVSAIVTGPTSSTLRFTIGTSRIWGIGFLPLGWSAFIGRQANQYADRLFDAGCAPDFAPLSPLIDSLFDGEPDEMAELQRIEAYFLKRRDPDLPDRARIIACHAALVDPDVSTVAEFAEATGIAAHTLERLCRRHFGFPPSLLLRRQRFMRSLAHYMLDPSLKWIGAIDGHYHDQAQFVRDFHRFMGMSPSEYAAAPHPILNAVMRARQEFVGSAVQALHVPKVD
ncbi:MAG: AraC family transcriptional regulator [Sphingomonadales bacterium]|nr:AraC family transcriptional regulator [Sphingomonadales bacterium]MDE2569162.1 AraC family transcriptional regulator [Sphingomonadales bacterium]